MTQFVLYENPTGVKWYTLKWNGQSVYPWITPGAPSDLHVEECCCRRIVDDENLRQISCGLHGKVRRIGSDLSNCATRISIPEMEVERLALS